MYPPDTPSPQNADRGQSQPVSDFADNLAKITDALANAARDSLDLTRNLPALAQVAAASTSPVKAALSAPLPSAYPNTPKRQNADNSQFQPSSAQSYRPAPVNFSVKNVIGGATVERLNYQYRAAEDARRGPSLVNA